MTILQLSEYNCRIIVIVIIIVSSNVIAQESKINFFVGLGSSNYLGDLGGRDAIGKDNSIVDLDIQGTRVSLSSGFYYTFYKNLSVSYALYPMLLRGDDKFTNEMFRKNRNLGFRSVVVENSVRLLYSYKLLTKIKNDFKDMNFSTSQFNFIIHYFVGFGVFYFNPQNKYNGRWYNLQPLGTEGQGLNGINKYRRTSVSIPYGITFSLKKKNMWHILLEFNFRKTFTDYLDDVSTKYFSNELIRMNRGEVAAKLADPNLGLVPAQLDNNSNVIHGLQRGDHRNKDMFFTIQLQSQLSETFKKRNRTHTFDY